MRIRGANVQGSRRHAESSRNKLMWREAESMQRAGEPGTLRQIYFRLKARMGLKYHGV